MSKACVCAVVDALNQDMQHVFNTQIHVSWHHAILVLQCSFIFVQHVRNISPGIIYFIVIRRHDKASNLAKIKYLISVYTVYCRGDSQAYGYNVKSDYHWGKMPTLTSGIQFSANFFPVCILQFVGTEIGHCFVRTWIFPTRIVALLTTLLGGVFSPY